MCQKTVTNGMTEISRLLQITGLFCRSQSLLSGSFAQETYDFKEATNRTHSIVILHGKMAKLVVICFLRIPPDSPCASDQRKYSLFETVSMFLTLSFWDCIHHFTLSSDRVNLLVIWRLSTSSRKWVMSHLCMSQDAPYLAGMIVIFDGIHHFTLSFDTVTLVVSWHLSTSSRKWVMSHLCMSHDTSYLAEILIINEDWITLASPCASDVHRYPWCYSLSMMLLIIHHFT